MVYAILTGKMIKQNFIDICAVANTVSMLKPLSRDESNQL